MTLPKNMCRENFEKLRQIVLENASLQSELQKVSEINEFIPRVIEIGERYDLHFGEKEITEAMRENRRAWIERWI